MNRKISFYGDILVDLVMDNDGRFVPQPGGSIFNTALTAAKYGYDVNFISHIGDDYWGRYILDTCKNAGISTDNLYRCSDIKTSLAFAIVDTDGNAAYDFYKQQSPHDFAPNVLSGSAIFHFGSTFALMPTNRHNIERFIPFCRENKILISYDPNCRPNGDAELMRHYCSAADIVKMSCDDAQILYPDIPPQEIAARLTDCGVSLTVITMGKNGACAFCRGGQGADTGIKSDKPIRNTIGAGDNFTAGMLNFIMNNDILSIASHSPEQTSALVQLCRAGNETALKHITRQ